MSVTNESLPDSRNMQRALGTSGMRLIGLMLAGGFVLALAYYFRDPSLDRTSLKIGLMEDRGIVIPHIGLREINLYEIGEAKTTLCQFVIKKTEFSAFLTANEQLRLLLTSSSIPVFEDSVLQQLWAAPAQLKGAAGATYNTVYRGKAWLRRVLVGSDHEDYITVMVADTPRGEQDK